jgi:hypothetical protein
MDREGVRGSAAQVSPCGVKHEFLSARRAGSYISWVDRVPRWYYAVRKLTCWGISCCRVYDTFLRKESFQLIDTSLRG